MPTSCFGSFRRDLAAGAANAVEVCLAVQRGERVALVADEPSAEVAASLERALEAAGAVRDCVLIEKLASRPLTHATQPVLDAVERADAGILCVQPQQGELGSRTAIVP